jgi:signal transduction histidine kinase/CheY-like chemotaxis protein
MAAVYELTPEATCGDARVVFDRLHPDDRAALCASIAQSAQALTPWFQQYRVVLPVRGLRWLEGHATPERQADGAVLWCGFIHDITERRAAEQVVRENFASERASRAKSEFLSRVSHELRTPLNAVLGFARLLQADASLNPRSRIHLDLVLNAGQLLLDLVNDILDLSRIEHGLLALHRGPVNVLDVLSASLALIEPLATERGVRIMPVRCSGAVVAQADARALGQVLLNLLSNGVKYNCEGGALWAELRCQGAEVVVCIADEGRGLTAGQRRQLFQPFNRLGAETGQVPGFGLGLVISKQLVEAMRGRLEVHDRRGGGCRFEVWLPRDPLPQRVVPAPRSPDIVLGPAPPADRGAAMPLVLCVEDNPVNALLIKEVISAIGGYRVLVAKDGDEALALAGVHRPTLMLSDINMPKMDGLALVQAIRADPALRAMRCIATSGDAMAAARDRALAAGFDAYWVKPLDLPVLEQVLRSHGAGRRVGA